MADVLLVRRVANGWVARLYRGRQPVDLVAGSTAFIVRQVRRWQHRSCAGEAFAGQSRLDHPEVLDEIPIGGAS